jgi:hypothetical protein
LSRLAERYGKRGVRFVGINYESLDPYAYGLLHRSWGFKYPSVQDADSKSLAAYQVNVFPSIFVLDRDHTVRAAYAGEPTERELAGEIASILE